MIGMRVQGSGNSYIPLKVNYAGVVPVIFPSSLLMFTISQFIGTGNWFGRFADALSPGSIPYLIMNVFLILFFTYFWTATQFHPDQIASEMKRGGAFISGGYFFGKTLLILIGVVLDTMKQIESHLIMKKYDEFMRKGSSYEKKSRNNALF
ncbi:hypothetical protein ACTFIW_000802 [Dictyostelium discoideum]